MTESKDLMVLDDAMLEHLAGKADKDDAGGEVKQLPVLKINYDPDSDHPRGAWVVGQRKDQDGNIVEQGQPVKGFVALLMRNRWSYYNQKNVAENCNSRLYLNGEQVRGNRLGNVCGKTCPMREEGRNPRCKAQKVLFGLAVTADGKMIECISYQSGASYMPTADYIDELKKYKAKGGYVEIPLYTYLTLLGSKKEKNAGTTYFVSQYKKGPAFGKEQWDAFEVKRSEANEYIERLNAMVASKAAESAPAEMASVAPESVSVTDPDVVDAVATPVEEPDDIPFEMPTFDESVSEGTSGVGTDAPAEAAGIGNPNFDIDNAIKNALAEDDVKAA